MPTGWTCAAHNYCFRDDPLLLFYISYSPATKKPYIYIKNSYYGHNWSNAIARTQVLLQTYSGTPYNRGWQWQYYSECPGKCEQIINHRFSIYSYDRWYCTKSNSLNQIMYHFLQESYSSSFLCRKQVQKYKYIFINFFYNVDWTRSLYKKKQCIQWHQQWW